MYGFFFKHCNWIEKYKQFPFLILYLNFRVTVSVEANNKSYIVQTAGNW